MAWICFSILLKVQQGDFMAKNTSCKTTPAIAQPKRLSKAGEWRLKHPKGLGVTIHDMRAVMR